MCDLDRAADGVVVLIVDPVELKRSVIERVVTAAGYTVCCVDAGSRGETVQAAGRHKPDLALVSLDVMGTALIAELLAVSPGTALVALGSTTSDSEFLGALRAGAVGYLPHSAGPEDVVAALHAASQGEAVIPRRYGRALATAFAAGVSSVHDLADGVGSLTGRERQILHLLREGLPGPVIAKRLLLAPATIRSHIRRIVVKLDAEDRSALTREGETVQP